MTITTEPELREALLRGEQFRVIGGNSCIDWLPKFDGNLLQLSNFDHIVDYRPDDLVIRVGSSMLLDDLNSLLAESGLCLPILRDKGWLGYSGKTVGGLVAMGLPHYGNGSIRDWVLGMRFMTGTGEIVESGANVVKSVAGFDLHRMMVGSRGGLGVILEVVLRLYPQKMMPQIEFQGIEGPCWIHRVPKSFACSQGVRNREIIWHKEKISIPPDGWFLGPGGIIHKKNDPLASRFRSNLKNELDPNGVLVEGWKQ